MSTSYFEQQRCFCCLHLMSSAILPTCIKKFCFLAGIINSPITLIPEIALKLNPLSACASCVSQQQRRCGPVRD